MVNSRPPVRDQKKKKEKETHKTPKAEGREYLRNDTPTDTHMHMNIHTRTKVKKVKGKRSLFFFFLHLLTSCATEAATAIRLEDQHMGEMTTTRLARITSRKE